MPLLLYLGANSHPEIAYAFHQCAHFRHPPKDSHAKAVKHILCYLNQTKDKGIILHPSKQLIVDCFMDADFAGQWNSEDPHDPLEILHRIHFNGWPLPNSIGFETANRNCCVYNRSQVCCLEHHHACSDSSLYSCGLSQAFA